ncbi:MAG: acyl-CoA dehydrogenase family protein [Actinomycetota bacterium]|nr:acyl-CoA dehydrogenase family protein [Actinomycetota bacterium]
MDFNDSAEEARVRAEARAWLEESFPVWRSENGDPPYTTEQARSWHRALAAGDYGAPHWPVEYGGRGYGPVESAIWAEEKARVGANIVFNMVGFGMAGPTIIAHGTEEQKQRHIRAMLNGNEIWCQLFSEPGAGSDLASLATRAFRDGDEWIVNGQKVWSSQADEADYGILLARFDPDKPKHEGLAYFIVDMHTPGVEVRPLRQIDGDAHFSEVFLSDVRVPDANRIGEPGDGWRVATTTLMHERMSIGTSTGGYTFPFVKLAEIARSRYALDPVVRDNLARVYTQERILDFLNKRILSKLRRGEIPTAEGSILKLAIANLSSDAALLGVHLLGPDGALAGEGPQQHFLWERSLHIGGGTDEIQRNVIAERVLGLPREARPDKGLPFSQTRTAG